MRNVRSGTKLLHPLEILEHVDVRARMHIADLGCGALGHFVFPAAELVGSKGVVYAVDILRDALEMIDRRAEQQGFSQVRTVWSDIDVYGGTHIPEGSVDMVLLVNNLFLSQNPEALAKEIARLTKRGGKVVVIDWKTTVTPVGPPIERRVSKEEARSFMTIPEFEPFDSFEAGPCHYGLVFQRTDTAAKKARTKR